MRVAVIMAATEEGQRTSQEPLGQQVEARQQDACGGALLKVIWHNCALAVPFEALLPLDICTTFWQVS